MRKVVTASFMGSGSSAVTDLLSEYEHVVCPNGSYEYVFLHCPGGLFDLEDKLLLCNNAVRSDEAIRTFHTMMKELYENGRWWFAGYQHKVSPAFMDAVEEFIDKLVCCSFEGYWYEHEKLDKARYAARALGRKFGYHNDAVTTLYGAQMTAAFPTSEEFYAAAAAFIERVLGCLIAQQDGKTLLLDQLFMPHNLNRLGRYFPRDDAKAVVVSRDPRDVFVLNKYHWMRQHCPVPLPLDAEAFCCYYRRMRAAVPAYDASTVLEARFEDLVLDYDGTVARIEAFMGDSLGAHVRKRELFNPALSARNVCVYRDSEEYSEEAALIARELPEYLYVPAPDVEFFRASDAEVF